MLNTEIAKPESIPAGSVLFDEDGYLLNQDLWSEQLGADIAADEGGGPDGEALAGVASHPRQVLSDRGATQHAARVPGDVPLQDADLYTVRWLLGYLANRRST